MIADTYAFLNNYEDAIIAYKLVVEKYSSSKSAINAQFMLGYIYANFLFDYDLARNEYETFLDKFSSVADSNLVESVKFELKNHKSVISGGGGFLARCFSEAGFEMVGIPLFIDIYEKNWSRLSRVFNNKILIYILKNDWIII